MDKAEVRTKYFREESAPDKNLIWDELVADRYVSKVCNGELNWEGFRERARLLADRQRTLLNREKPSGRSLRPLAHTVELSDLEAEYASAIGLYLAKQAAILPEVRRFRETWGGGTLSPEQVVAFLEREMKSLYHEDYKYLTARVKEAYGIFVIGEKDELKDLVGGWKNRSETSKSQFFGHAFLEALQHDSMPYTIAEEKAYRFGAMHLLSDEFGRTLEDAGRELAYNYPWTLRDAAWFVLTGEPPKFTSLRIHTDAASGAYTLTFAPWISEKTFRRAYRQLHTSDNRPLSTKSLSVFRFVQEHTDPGQKPEWAKLVQRWNARHPNDLYDRSALRKMYKRAEERLVGPWAGQDYLQYTAEPMDV